ncbi:MAG: hypothetical protein KDD89_06985 [Anaerolineales bacterium]|nr:hypothetical protein [Anaerolineales bacterium]
MKEYIVTLSMPQSVYEPLQQIAETTNRPLADVVLQTVRCGMPPSLKKVPAAFHHDLLALNKADDTELWRIVQGKDLDDQPHDTLHTQADYPTLRRAYAFSLLKWRGHPVPSPSDIMID